ncbi:MAG: LysM peptidoglycan-binding domain-containing protein, partial [Clostridia bacterium]|nr:LysM peptidoglycan-binding domain-containing protein [Clostridia bacterium]
MKESILNARMPQFLQHKKIWLTVVGIFAVIAALFIGIDRNSSLMLTVDGQALAVVAGEETVNQALDSLKTAREKESGVTIAGFSNELAYAENPDSSKKPVSAEALAVLLKDKLEWESACWAIKISGKPDLYFKSEADAGQALEMIKEYYLPKEGAQQIEHIAFAEDVDIQQETTVMNALLTPETAVDVMVKGLNKIIKHTVQNGDTLWAIAKNNNMTVDELKEINTELKSDFL